MSARLADSLVTSRLVLSVSTPLIIVGFLSLATTTSAIADDGHQCCLRYLVTGAGTTEVNGIYEQSRLLRDGVRCYTKGVDPQFTILRFVFPLPSTRKFWYLSELASIVSQDKDYYRAASEGSLPPERLNEPFPGKLGKSPDPILSCLEPVPCSALSQTQQLVGADRPMVDFAVTPNQVQDLLQGLGHVVSNSSSSEMELAVPSSVDDKEGQEDPIYVSVKVDAKTVRLTTPLAVPARVWDGLAELDIVKAVNQWNAVTGHPSYIVFSAPIGGAQARLLVVTPVIVLDDAEAPVAVRLSPLLLSEAIRRHVAASRQAMKTVLKALDVQVTLASVPGLDKAEIQIVYV